MALVNLAGISYEDTYVLNGNPEIDATPSTLVKNNNQIVITCVNKKRRVSGYLSEGIQIDGEAQWEEMFGGGITALAGSVIDTANKIDQLGLGMTIQQPWMNRKFYKSSKPFSLNFNVSFVAETDARTDVYEPCQALLSFIYPRSSNISALDLLKDAGLFQDAQPAGGGRTGGVVGNLADAISNYYIPGPSINYGNKSAEGIGDPVTLVIGSVFVFGSVYLENVNVEFSSSFDPNGYPLAAKVKLKATCMDVNSCDNDGNFLISGFQDASAGVANTIESVKQTISQAGKDIKEVWKSWIGMGRR